MVFYFMNCIPQFKRVGLVMAHVNLYLEGNFGKGHPIQYENPKRSISETSRQ